MDELQRASSEAATGAAGEHEIASEVSERIRAIISSAEAAANAVRHEAEQRAAVKRRLAEEEARRIVDDARRDAEAYLAERIRRIAELSDAVVERGEGIVMRLDRAEEVRRQLQGLADALGESAEELARELGGPSPERRTPAAAATGTASPVTDKPSRTADTARAEAPAADASPASAEASPATADPDTPAAEDSASVEAEIADDPTVGELAEASSSDEDTGGEVVELVKDDSGRSPREPDEQLSARLVALQMAVAGGKRDEVETHLRRTFDLSDVGQILDDVFGNGDDTERAGWPSRGDGAA